VPEGTIKKQSIAN